MTTEQVIQSLGALKGKCTFIGVHRYESKEVPGEVSNYVLRYGISYYNAVSKSLLELTLLTPELQLLANQHNMPLASMTKAHQELMDSFKETLEKHPKGEYNSKYTKPGLYVTVVPGIHISLADSTLEIYGLCHSKKILVQGVKPTVLSSTKTQCKAILRSLVPVGKYRTLCFENITSLKVDGETLFIEGQTKTI